MGYFGLFRHTLCFIFKAVNQIKKLESEVLENGVNQSNHSGKVNYLGYARYRWHNGEFALDAESEGDMMGNKVYDVITDRIISIMEKGTVPWNKPWNSLEPKNLISGKEYRGVNTFLLACTDHASPYFLTFKQAKSKGGSIRKGAKGYPVIFWKFNDKDLVINDDDGMVEVIPADKRAPLLRYYTVFNVEQCDGVQVPESKQPELHDVPVIDRCESVVTSMPNAPEIKTGEARAYYAPSRDMVNMPRRELFTNAAEYYSVLYHELGHSTGHEKRLNRNTLTDLCPFGSTNYSKEELVAEMTAAYLCGHTRIDNTTIDNSAAYIDGWLSRLRNDRKLVIMAAAQAQKAADYILNRKVEV